MFSPIFIKIRNIPIVPSADIKTEDATETKEVFDAEIKKEPEKMEDIYCENCVKSSIH